MTLLHTCDNLNGVIVTFGTAEVDTTDKVEGIGSLSCKTLAESYLGYFTFNWPGDYIYAMQRLYPQLCHDITDLEGMRQNVIRLADPG